MSYIVVSPHSLTNPSEFFLVTEYDTWLQRMNQGVPLSLGEVDTFTVYSSAREAADAKNRYQERAPESEIPGHENHVHIKVKLDDGVYREVKP